MARISQIRRLRSYTLVGRNRAVWRKETLYARENKRTPLPPLSGGQESSPFVVGRFIARCLLSDEMMLQITHKNAQ